MSMEAFAIRENASAFEATGTVVAVTDGAFGVWTGDETVEAKRAVSCLVAPEEGDLVRLVRLVTADAYVLAVLERPTGRCARISTDGDLALELPSGRFTVSAAEGIDLVSREAVSFAADRLEARAREGSLFLGSVKLIAGAVDTMLERLSQSAKRVFRRVEEVDHLRAGQIDYAAEGLTRLHGEHTLVTARELVKADGKQIHFG
jgi:hypothetical protein